MVIILNEDDKLLYKMCNWQCDDDVDVDVDVDDDDDDDYQFLLLFYHQK